LAEPETLRAVPAAAGFFRARSPHAPALESLYEGFRLAHTSGTKGRSGNRRNGALWRRWLLLPVALTVTSCGLFQGEGPRPNIILITVDALRPDHLGFYGYQEPTTPFLDKIAAESCVFDFAFSSSGWTTPGLISVLTGLHAPAHRVDRREYNLSPAVVSLAEALRDAGYAAPDLCYLVGAPSYQNLGFESNPEKEELLPQGHEILFQWLRRHAIHRSPFFVFYHNRYVHQPYDPVAPYDTMFVPRAVLQDSGLAERVSAVRSQLMIPAGSLPFVPEDARWIQGLYDGAVRQQDDTFFKPLFATLEESGLSENTVVIVSADHGEELLDRGHVGHGSTSLKSTLFEEIIRIPLVVWAPGRFAPGRVRKLVHHVDLMPTILDLAGADAPPFLQGRSLVPLLRGKERGWQPSTIFCETIPGGYQADDEMAKTRIRCARSNRWKLVRVTGPETDHAALYDLDADLAETLDVASENREVVESLSRSLAVWIADCQQVYAATSFEEGVETVPPDASAPAIVSPVDGDTLRYELSQGVIILQCRSEPALTHMCEYDIGKTPYHLTGTFSFKGSTFTYPVSRKLWQNLAMYNPWKIRVYRKADPEKKSDWTAFHVAAP
jgi:arylsulfatase A-like enzyme